MAIVVKDANPAWLDWLAPERFNNAELFRIVTFFVFHSPCAGQSAMIKPIQGYGWSNKPWFKPEKLKLKLLECTTSLEQGLPLLFAASRYDEMDVKLAEANLLNDFPLQREYERAAFVNTRGNQFMSVFGHIRNSFAHGRLNMVDTGLQNDYVFVMEDTYKNKVSARMILRKSTLLKWIALIEGGHVEEVSP